MTTILALDASTGPCSVAVWSGNRISAYLENLTPTTQAAQLIPMIEQALRESGLSYSDLTNVATTIGPGSFTGIRIGLASAQGIAFAAGIPSAGYTTLDVLAYAAGKKGPNHLAILNAGKGEVYYQVNHATPQLGALEDAFSAARQSPVIVAGNVMIDKVGFSPCGITFPRADIVAEMAASGAVKAQLVRPFYIRPPDAKLPKNNLLKNN